MNYKGEIKGFPQEVVEKMLDRQEEQGNPRDVTVFEVDPMTDKKRKGFNWDATREGFDFWDQVLMYRKFDIFFEKYSK